MNVPRQKSAGDLSKKGIVDLRGSIEDELTSSDSGFSRDNVRLLRHHGVFQQDNRDERYKHDGPRLHQFMVRIRTTAGKLSACQLLAQVTELSGHRGFFSVSWVVLVVVFDVSRLLSAV
jgi:sulfite reductase beta subunit-like hemoprotein